MCFNDDNRATAVVAVRILEAACDDDEFAGKVERRHRSLDSIEFIGGTGKISDPN